MDRKEFKRELLRLYVNCGSYILQMDSTERGGNYITTFRHPIQEKIIEVTEDEFELKCVLVYNQTTNATQRHSVECKTIEQFRKAIG